MFLRLILTIVLANGIDLKLPAEQLDEYRVKAAFLYNFARFVDWPAEAFPTPGDLSLFVFSAKTLSAGLWTMWLPVKRSADGPSSSAVSPTPARPAGARSCSLVPRRISALSPFLRLRSTPAFSRSANAANSTSGGLIIDFTLENGKVRFEINRLRADREPASIRGFLSLATGVRNDPCPWRD